MHQRCTAHIGFNYPFWIAVDYGASAFSVPLLLPAVNGLLGAYTLHIGIHSLWERCHCHAMDKPSQCTQL